MNSTLGDGSKETVTRFFLTVAEQDTQRFFFHKSLLSLSLVSRVVHMSVRPEQLKRVGEGLSVVWSDGRIGRISWRKLRAACPCATCEEDRAKPPNPFRVLSAREVAAGAPDAVGMEPVGHYAYRIRWNDGHDAGIYPLSLLYSLTESE